MRVLFTGYAPVHFLCFRPLYEALVRTPGVEVQLSGGTRSKSPQAPGGYLYDADEMYGRSGSRGTVLPVAALTNAEYDVMFSANTQRIEPRRVDRRIQIFHGMSFRNRAIRSETDGAENYFFLGPYMKRGFEATGILRRRPPRRRHRLPQDRPAPRRLARPQGDAGEPRDQRRPPGRALRAHRRAAQLLETMGEELIAKLDALDRYDILVKLHDHPHGESTGGRGSPRWRASTCDWCGSRTSSAPCRSPTC